MKQISYFLRSIYRKLPGIAIRFISKPNPVLIEGFNARNKVGNICKENGYSKCLLITDETLFSLGFHIEIVNSLKENNIGYVIYNDINCEPNIKTIFSARQIAIDSNIDCVIALGGGSVLDNAKMIAVGLKYKNLSIENLLLKILFVGKMVPIINIPSTAGTGAEISVGAVVKDNKGVKRATCISGLNVSHIILDSQLTINTPSKVTSYCGIDALSHCIEGIVADINVDSHIRETSYEGVNIVFNALPILIDDPNNLEKRQAMQRAAYYGGLAISCELAGYVHAFAHTIGAKYKISHGGGYRYMFIARIKKTRECL